MTEIYSYIVQSASASLHGTRDFGLSPDHARENAEAARFLEVFMFRRYLAKLQFELEFWSRFGADGGTSAGYAERLTEATGSLPVRPIPRRHGLGLLLGRLSAGVDPLRTAPNVSTSRGRRGLVVPPGDRQTSCAQLFREGTQPSNEEIAGRIGFDALDMGPLIAELTTSR